MGIIELCSLSLLGIFTVAYVFKLILLYRKDHIKANVFGKGSKPRRTLLVEKGLRAVTFAGAGVWILSCLMPGHLILDGRIIRVLGLGLTFIGVLVFILAMGFMKTSWRVGVDKSTKTTLVTDGLYRFSRNPAFVGMDLMYLGAALSLSNPAMLVAALLVVLMLHLQILQEEAHMREMFSREYMEYEDHTPRYLLF